MDMGYKKDIFAVFAYEFELSQYHNSFLIQCFAEQCYLSLTSSLLSFIWKRQFERIEKNEKRKVKRTKRNDNFLVENCRFFLAGVAGFEPTNAAVKVLCLTA